MIDSARKIIPVEIKYSEFTKPVVPRSFYAFIDKYAPEKCMVVNKNLKTAIEIKDREVLFLTVWDLLSEEINV